VLITLAEAARMAGVSKGAVRKALAAGKMTATRDEQGRWRVHVADVERVWPPRAPVTGYQRDPIPVGDREPRAPGEAELASRLAVAEALLGERERQIDDLRARLAEAERERRELQGKALALIEHVRGPSWWRRLWGS
jgi:excisionase family DNA binding protein